MDILQAPLLQQSMPGLQNGYWFTSRLFSIQRGEDDLTRPGKFGEQLAHWLTRKLQDHGYHAEPIPEEWGWCVLISNPHFTLYVGCVNANKGEALSVLENEASSEGRELAWHCYVVAEPGFLSLRATREAAQDAARQLNEDVGEILRHERRISILSEPSGPWGD